MAEGKSSYNDGYRWGDKAVGVERVVLVGYTSVLDLRYLITAMAPAL